MPELLFRIRGRVQGVGFRWWTRSHAQRLGVTGSVRNHDDGSVEVRARGTDAALRELEALLREGPPHARVDAIDAEPTSGTSDAGFQITR